MLPVDPAVGACCGALGLVLCWIFSKKVTSGWPPEFPWQNATAQPATANNVAPKGPKKCFIELCYLLCVCAVSRDAGFDCSRFCYPWTTGTSTQSLVRMLPRSEEHTSELQSHSFISYAVFC